MKIEHRLSETMAAAVARMLEQIQQFDQTRLIALGRAKEAELSIGTLRLALGEQLAVVQATEGLPRSLTPYQLSADGTMLIGEIPDMAPPAAGPIVELPAPAAAGGPVNGLDHA